MSTDGDGNGHLFHDRRQEGRRHGRYYPPVDPHPRYEQQGSLGVWHGTLLKGAALMGKEHVEEGYPHFDPHAAHPQREPGWS